MRRCCLPLPNLYARLPELAAFVPRGLCIVLLSALATAGCQSSASRSANWPATPTRTFVRNGDLYEAFDVNADRRLDLIRRQRDGFVDRFYFAGGLNAAAPQIVRRPAAAPAAQPTVMIILDGVAYERFKGLYKRGHFRLFTRPALLIPTFPTLTDPILDRFFGTGPTPGYEAGYYNAEIKRLSDAYHVYLSGANKPWLRESDYRIGTLLDALMYLAPRRIYYRDLRTARAALDARLAAGDRRPIIYFASTDALGHMLTPPEIDAELRIFDRWLQRLLYDYRGQLELILFSDHGMNTTSEHMVDIADVVREKGLRVTERLRRPGDVVIPRFGLLDLARMHTFDASTRDKLVAALSEESSVELLAWRDEDSVTVQTARGRATLRAGELDGVMHYHYDPTPGDALVLGPALDAMRAAGTWTAEHGAPAEAWRLTTAEHPFPMAPVRLWDGFFVNSVEQPDVAISLKPDWYAGSGFLATVADLKGTHGGLHARASNTFATATAFTLPSPLDHDRLRDIIEETFDFDLPARPPHGVRNRKN
jgi:hypothetical protein